MCHNSFYLLIHTILQRSLEDLESVLSVALESLLSSFPVDDLPDILDICSLSVKVLMNHKVSQGTNLIKTLEEKRLTCK